VKPTVGHVVRSVARRLGYEIIPVEAALPRPLRADYQPLLEVLGSYRFKFLDVKTFLPTTMARAHRIGLTTSSGLDILDIGTGAGYFPVVCKYYGHRAMAIDRDGNPVFEDVTRWLDVDRRSCEIHAFEPIPDLGRAFDLVTAFMVNFDRYEPPEYRPWGPSEWEFFLTDVARRHLKDGGRLVLLLNNHTRDLPSVMQFFADRAGRVDGSWVEFQTLASFR
jgi:SAM-dependent methyltransferase